MHAELYTRDDHSRWIFTETRAPAAVLDLSSISCQAPLPRPICSYKPAALARPRLR